MWLYLIIPIIGIWTFIEVIRSKQNNFGKYYYVNKITAAVIAPIIVMLISGWIVQLILWLFGLIFN